MPKADATICPLGHEMTPENTRTRRAGGALCRTCERAYHQRYAERQKAAADAARALGVRPYAQTHCVRDHEFTPENTRLVRRIRKDGVDISNKVCLTCEKVRHAQRILRKRTEATVPKVKGLRTHCPKDHPLTGANVITSIDKSTGQVRSRSCRICRNAYMKIRERLVRRGIKPPLQRQKFGSVKEKVRAFMIPEGECLRWSGPLGGGSTPVVAHEGQHYMVRRWVCEQHAREIPHTHRPVVPRTCHPLCVRNEHILIASGGELYRMFQTPESRAQANATLRRKYGKDREQFLIMAFRHVPALRGALLRRTHLHSDVEDIIQEAILAAYLTWLDDHEAIVNLKAWLMTAAGRLLIDLARTAWKRRTESLTRALTDEEAQEADTDMQWPAPPEADPYLQLQIAEVTRLRRRLYLERMREIPERARRCLRLKLAGRSSQDVARAMGIAEHTVEQHLAKAYRILHGPAHPMWRRRRKDSYFLEAIVA